jgi:V/A-type H+-transporting ATPase subunit I
MSLRPASARWFELLTAREALTQAVETLARTGSVELETHSDTRTRVNLPDLQERMVEFNQLARRFHPYWPQASLQPSTVPGTPDRILDTALGHLRRWVRHATPLVRKLESLQAEESELALLEDLLAVTGEDTLDYALLAGAGPALSVRLFVLPGSYQMTQMPGSLLYCKCRSAEHAFLLAVGLPTDLESFRSEVAAQKGRVVTLPVWLHGRRELALGQVRERLARIAEERNELRRRIDALAGPHHLLEALGDIGRLEWFLTHVTDLPVTENFAWVTGWTSDLDGTHIQKALDTAGVDAIVRYPPPPRDVRPPMVLQNPWWARPFELFARMLGTPSGDEVDPSRMVALLVPLLFGYMFGDVGQGLVLLLAGLAFQRRWPFLRILIANGSASMLFGIVFGSVFGREDVIPALWVHPIEQPLPVLLVPLAGGVVVLLLGLALNAAESWWRGELSEWLRVEAAVVVMYVSLLAALFVPASLLITAFGLFWYLAGSLWQTRTAMLSRLAAATGALLENMMQLLINTISFVRVGAFALAHAGLSLAFTIMAAATQNIIASFLIMLVGNVVVILLEGLVVTIQTTRLVLFEFFIRFLRGSGRMFRPLTVPEHGIDTRE